MKIGIVKRGYTEKEGGGAERYASFISNELSRRGHYVYIISDEFDESATRENITHIPVKFRKLLSSSKTMAFHRSVRKELQKIKTDENLDLIYALSRTYPSDVFRVTEQIHAEWMKINYSIYQKLNPRHRGILKLEKKIFSPKTTKSVVTNSELSKKLIKDYYNFPERRILIIRNGVDKEKYYPLQVSENKYLIRKRLFPEDEAGDKAIFLFVANDFKVKGLEYALKALGELKDSIKKRILFVVIGNDNSKKYKSIAKHLGLVDNVKFIGKKENLRDYFIASDILLYPSIGEPFANVCLEACTCGLPVITSANNGASEIITHKKNGFIVPSAKNVDLLYRYIKDFLKLNSKGREDMSENAVKSAELYSWKTHTDNLEDLFSRIKNQEIY